jgi:hypothetical protein
MFASTFTSGSKHRRGEIILLLAALSAAVPLAAARAEGCAFALQGEGRVAEIVDGRSFRLTDGREIRLAGIEPVRSATAAIDGTAVLTSILAGQDVTLRGADDSPRQMRWSKACCSPKARRWSAPTSPTKGAKVS